MKYRMYVVLFFSISCSMLTVAMDEDLLNVIIKANNGETYEIKVNKTDDKVKVKDLKNLLIKNTYDNKSYDELKKIAIGALLNNVDKALEDENEDGVNLIKNIAMKLVLLEDVSKKKVLNDTSPLEEENDKTYIFKDSFFGLSETSGAKAIKAIAGLLGNPIEEQKNECLDNVLIENQITFKQSTHPLDYKNDKIWDNLNLKEYSKDASLLAKIINDLLIIAEYIGRLDQFVLSLPDLLEQYPEVLKAEEFFITDPDLKKRIENILCSAYIKKMVQTFAEMTTLQPTQLFGSKSVPEMALALHPTEELLMVGLGDNIPVLSLRDLRKLSKEDLEIKASNGKYISSIEWNAKGNIVGAGLGYGCIKIWDLTSDKRDLFEVSGNKYEVKLVRWHPIIEYVIAAASQKTIRILDIRNEKNKKILGMWKNKGSVTSLAWSPDGKLLAAVVYDDISERKGDFSSGKPYLLYDDISQSKSCFISGKSYYHAVIIWDMNDLKNSKEKTRLRYDDKGSTIVSALAWHPRKNGLIAIAKNDGVVEILDVTSNPSKPKLKARYEVLGKKKINTLKWHPTEELLLLGAGSDVIILHTSDFDNITLKTTLSDHQDSVTSVVWHPRKPMIISADKKGCVIISGPKISLKELIGKILNLEKSERLKINKEYVEKKEEEADQRKREEWERQEEQKEKEKKERKKQQREKQEISSDWNFKDNIKSRDDIIKELNEEQEEKDRMEREELEKIEKQKKENEEKRKLESENQRIKSEQEEQLRKKKFEEEQRKKEELEDDQLLKEIQSNQIIIFNIEAEQKNQLQPVIETSLNLIGEIKIDDKQEEDDSLKQEKEATTFENKEKFQETQDQINKKQDLQNQYQDQQKEKKDGSQSTSSFLENLVNATKKFFINPIFSAWTWVKSWFW